MNRAVLIITIILPGLSRAVPIEQQMALEFYKNAATLSSEIGRINQVVTPIQYCDFLESPSELCRHTYQTQNARLQTMQLCRSIGPAFESTSSLATRFCSSVERTCEQLYPNRFIDTSSGFSIASCRNDGNFDSGGLPCHASDQVVLERKNDPLLKKQVFQSASSIFAELTDPTGIFSQDCCRQLADTTSQAECRQNLSQTAFRVGKRQDLAAIEGINNIPMRSIAQTISKRDISNPRNVINTMIISEDLLLSHLDHHSLRNLILHELTHACQISRHVPEGPDAMDRFLYPISGSTRANHLETLKEDIRSLVSENYLNCIQQAMPASMGEGIDEALWLREVLAEANASGAKPDPRAWAMSCFQTHHDGHQDHLHPPRDIVLGCLLKHQADSIRTGLSCQ